MLAYVASILGYIYAIHSFGLLMGYIFLYTECFFQLLKFMCRYNQLHFLSKYIHFTRPNDIRGGALTLKNLATLDDEKVCWFWHCTTFFFCNYILQFSFQSVDGESLATSSAGNIDNSKKIMILWHASKIGNSCTKPDKESRNPQMCKVKYDKKIYNINPSMVTQARPPGAEIAVIFRVWPV